MQKDRIKYVILICVLLSALVVVRHYARKPVDWKITFDYRHKAPYGCFVMNDLFHALFSDSIVYNNESVYDNDLIKKAAGRNLVIITGQFDPDDAESGSLFDFVGKGNTAFISAQDIPDDFLDTLGLSVRSGTMDQPLFKQANVRLNFYNPVLKKDSGYVFRPVMMPSYFNVKKSFQGKLLGYDSLGRVNYVACRWEKGTFLIHTRPLVFTNLQLLYGDPDYASAALSYLPDQPLIIDRYFKPYRMINRSPTRFILSEAPLRAAFYLILFVMLVYMILGSKRKQRTIPVIEPLKNTSVEFIQTVGRLYFKSENHTSIAQKKTIYFREFLRERYFISDISEEEDVIALIVAKTGVNETLVRKMVKRILYFEHQDNVSKALLMAYYHDMEEFYDTCL